MATVQESVDLDGQKLEQFVFRAVDEVGATLNAALVVMGDKLGLYRALAGAGGLTPVELARRTGRQRALRARVAERPGRGRLRGVRPGRRHATRFRLSRRSPSPTRRARPFCPASFRSRSAR